jgi:hypothetical protein
MNATARQWLGVILRDLPRYLPALVQGGNAHLRIANRGERLEPAPDASGYRCEWQWTSNLRAPAVMPALGRELMRRALAAHPIVRGMQPATPHDGSPQVSFIIGHRGLSRLPHLLMTLESIAGQAGAAVECIVVEQDARPRIAHELPAWVRYVHTACDAAMPYCRSATFNAGAQHARAPVLVLHDNDMLVPAGYAAQLIERTRRGYDVVNLKRFVFYLGPRHTQEIFDRRAGLADVAPEAVVQNLEAGGSLAITRAGFDCIGGMDEAFVGWGGEDNEFWERASTLRVWPWANLPIVHLWHAAQPGKQDADAPTLRLHRELAATDPRERIARLQARRER